MKKLSITVLSFFLASLLAADHNAFVFNEIQVINAGL